MKYCECGCGQLVKCENSRFCVGHSNKVKKNRDAISKRMKENNPMKNPETAKKQGDSIRGKNHVNYGKKHSLVTRMRQSKALKGKYVGEKASMFGKKQSKEHIKKRTKAMKGKKLSEETKRKISKSRMGFKPKPFSKEHKRKISEGHRGKHLSKETRKKISKNREGRFLGENSPVWLGGISFEPYGLEFNKKLKLKIRQRDNFTCQECKYTEKHLGYTLNIHHIDYNKRNNSPNNLICLCRSCHTKTNFKRKDWIKYFQNERSL